MLRINKSIALLHGVKNIILGGNMYARTLYSAATLGLDGYEASREKAKTQFIHNIDNFREKMNKFVEDNPANMIFTEDLKNMLHLVEKDSNDVDLIVKMIKKFNSQNKELRFGNFIFGPVVMRMFYYLGDVEAALKTFKDPELEGFFDQLITFQLLLDLLYEKGRYQDILDVFDIIKTRQIQGGKYSKHCIVLVFAACYKMNTTESFEYCQKLWRELNEVGHIPMRKAAAFAAGLALNQNAPHVALELLSTQKDQQYLTIRNLKTLAYAEMNRPEDAIPVLRLVLEIDNPIKTKRTFLKDIVDKVRQSIEKNNRKDLESDFNRIEKFLNENGHISEEKLSDILCKEISSTNYTAQRRDKTFIAASFSRDGYRQKGDQQRSNYRRRQGLQDLY